MLPDPMSMEKGSDCKRFVYSFSRWQLELLTQTSQICEASSHVEKRTGRYRPHLTSLPPGPPPHPARRVRGSAPMDPAAAVPAARPRPLRAVPRVRAQAASAMRHVGAPWDAWMMRLKKKGERIGWNTTTVHGKVHVDVFSRVFENLGVPQHPR